ncbi:phage tail protein [Cupriavidus campinensis]|uniref:Phage tail protein n=1 Tax=Cupriavidus campinensis TaxID=151783 RepID=A0AAE9HZ08_9BURK|nr:phage tail protein [Cupriavidus campinensis]URF02962.1 phage tail protein [Cupriavidus campinensis]
MPAAAAAAVAAAVAAAGTTAAVVAVAYTITYAVVALAISFAVGALMGAIFKPRSNNGFAAEAQGRTQVVRSNVQPRNIIYGTAMTSGPLIFAASTNDQGKNNQLMHLVIALADHECEAIDEVYLGEDPVGTLDGSGYPVGGKFRKTWGESAVKTQNVSGQSSVTVDLGQSARKMVSVIVKVRNGSDLDEQLITAYGWQTGDSRVVINNLDPAAEVVVITYEAGRSRPLVRIHKHPGDANQEADGTLISEVPGWTSAHRLRGVCYLYIRLDFDADVFPNGLPNIKAIVRGKRVFDPRIGNTYYTNNWALCIYDYLRDQSGFGCTDADIDVASVIAAANVSDEVVAAGGGLQQRYICNGVVMSDKSPRDNLAEMITAGGGVVTITGGVFRVFAGAYDVPTVTLTESDLRGSVKVRPRISRKDLFNVVKGTFVDPSHYWQPSDFPPVKNDTYAAQDGEVIERDIELPFTTDSIVAQRLAKIILERSRQGITVEFPAKLTAFQLTAYSTVKLSLAKFGWTNKVFRVMSWKMSDDGGIDLVLNEEAAAVYDWNGGDATVRDPAPDTNLPNPFQIENVGQILMDSGDAQLILSQSGVVISRVLVTWPAAQEASLSQSGRTEVQYKRAADSDWTALPLLPADTTSLYLSPVEDGVAYVVRARFVSALGVRSPAWSYSPVHTVVGKLAPPRDLTGLSLTALNGMANLTWDAASDLDVRNGGQARIRHTTDLVQPTWGSAIDFGGYISGAANSAQLPLLTGVYLAKWVDSTGHESANAAIVITTAPWLANLNIVATVAEHPGFEGAKSSIVFDPALNGIKLIGSGLIDDQGLIDASGLWDSQPQIDTLGPVDTVVGTGGWGLIDSLGGIVESGTYTFAGALDLGVAERSRLTATVDTVAFDTGDTIDDRFELVDSWQSIDGDLVSDTAVSLYVRTTPDDSAGSPTWSAWQRFTMGDYEARAFQWKVVMESGSPTHNVLVTGLSVTVDMPDRREYARDVVSAAAPQVVTFEKPFRIVPAIGVTAQNMVQGDYFTVTAKSESGFTINFFNSTGTPVSRKFDWDAIGY